MKAVLIAVGGTLALLMLLGAVGGSGRDASSRQSDSAWDCTRDGVQGAPVSALCDPGDREAYNAVLQLGIRTERAALCGWPKADDERLVNAYIARLPDAGRSAQAQKGFDDMLKDHSAEIKAIGVRPQTRAELCTDALRQKIEKLTVAARKVLRSGPTGEFTRLLQQN